MGNLIANVDLEVMVIMVEEEDENNSSIVGVDYTGTNVDGTLAC